MQPINVDEIISGILDGDRYTLSKGITLMESSLPHHKPLKAKLISACISAQKPSLRIGVSGAPGVGKSTFIDCLGDDLINQGHRLAVLAIDPSSQTAKGSILGDKTRMQKLLTSEHAFIRPSPNANYLGGIAKFTFESCILCEAAGFDIILIETVGVGQAEIQAKHIADIFLLLLQPAAGDTLQALKKGIVEIADLLVIHKADGALLEVAKSSASYYKSALHLIPGLKQRQIPVFLASSMNCTGMDLIWKEIMSLKEEIDLTTNRSIQMLYWFREHVRHNLLDMAFSRFIKEMERKEQDIIKTKSNYYDAAEDMLKHISKTWNSE